MAPAPQATAFCDAVIFTGEAMVENHALIVRDGKVVDIVSQNRVPSSDTTVHCGGRILAPGLIDIQVNGGGNKLFNATPDPATVLHIAAAHRRFGTTRLLPTLISDDFAVTESAIDAARRARSRDPSVLGIHIEGPHLDPGKRGVHKKETLRPLEPRDANLYHRRSDEVMLITLAPEHVSTEDIALLSRQGILVSLGHTQAPSDVARSALRAGASGFTHLFNGMAAMTAREPGVVGVALDDADSWCGLIADGFHVADELLRLALRAKPRGKIYLVSDAMPPSACSDPQAFTLYGERIAVSGGRCLTETGTLAGSGICLMDAVRYLVSKVGVALEDSLRMASLYPACFLRCDDRIGKLLPGYATDIVAVTPDLDLEGVWLGGIAVN